MPTDTIASPFELLHILAEADTGLDGLSLLGDHASIWHNGLVVAVRVYSPGAGSGAGDPTTGYRVYRWNGASWDNLDFPSEVGEFGPSFTDSGQPTQNVLYPQPYGEYMRLASDGTTLWFACLIDETQHSLTLGPSAQPGQDDIWRTSTTYVFSFDESSGWTGALREPGQVRRNAGDIGTGQGAYSHELATHEGAGYCWLVLTEAGIAGVTYKGELLVDGHGIFPNKYVTHHPELVDSRLSAYKVTPSGVEDQISGFEQINPSWYYEEFNIPPGNVVDGPEPALTPPFTGSANGMADAHVYALVTDAGFPVAITDIVAGNPASSPLLDWTIWDVLGDGSELLPQAPLTAVRCDTLEQLQASNQVMPIGSTRPVTRHTVADGKLWLITVWDPATSQNVQSIDLDLFYPEEIDNSFVIVGPGIVSENTDDRGRVRLFTIPVDASTDFAPLADATGEDISLAKTPLESFGPQEYGRVDTYFGAITSDKNVWLLTHAFDLHGDGLIYPFHLGTCPLAPPEHGRYAWQWEKDAVGQQVNLAPYFSDGGIFFVGADWFNGPINSLFNTVYNPDDQRIYVTAWAQSEDGNTYLRAWYFQLCVGCGPCTGVGIHLWAEV